MRGGAVEENPWKKTKEKGLIAPEAALKTGSEPIVGKLSLRAA